METKFEYQVSPELAEKIALEQFDVLLPLRGFKLRYLPLGMGCLIALLFSLIPGTLNFLGVGYIPRNYFSMGGNYYAFTENFLIVPIGFVVGLAIGLFINYFIQWKIFAMARSAYAKMGPTRTVSWNSEGITLQSPVYETKVHWQMIDRIEVRSLGVYGLSRRKAFFAIGRDAFPASATIGDLIKAWKSCTKQPAIIA